MRLAVRGDGLLERAGRRLGLAPEPLWEAFAGFMLARTVMAGGSLGVLQACAQRPHRPDALPGLDADGAAALCVALHTAGYLDARRDGTYVASRKTRRWLLPLAPYLAAFNYDQWDGWSQLEDVLRSGRPLGLHDRPAGDPHWERYGRGLHALSAIAAPPVVRAAGFGAARSLLDLGGFHGGFAAAFCDRHPQLEAVVVDLPGAVAVGRALTTHPRVSWLEGDFFDVELPRADAAFLGHVLHHLDPDACVRLLQRVRAALGPGGRVAVFELERPRPGRRGDQLGVLTGLMFWCYSGARTYTGAELTGFVRAAGFARVRVRRPLRLGGNLVVTGFGGRAHG